MTNHSSASSEGKLIVCPTPLGNLGDITQRALNALRCCDVVCCEDTRVTGKLLAALGIDGKRLERLDEAMMGQAAQRVVTRIANGDSVAYCSDAGMPGVSDPGQRLIAAVYEADQTVEVLPGGTALATAYVASGFIAPSFYFGGFFPRKQGDRIHLLESLRTLSAVLVFYESPQRIVSALETLGMVLPYRQVAVCRELTKLHEEVLRGCVQEVYAILAERQERAVIKGEIVLVIDAPNEEEQEHQMQESHADARVRATELLSQEGMSKKDIVAMIRKEFGLSRNEAYDLVHSS